jgi:hypothetical protein
MKKLTVLLLLLVSTACNLKQNLGGSGASGGAGQGGYAQGGAGGAGQGGAVLVGGGGHGQGGAVLVGGGGGAQPIDAGVNWGGAGPGDAGLGQGGATLDDAGIGGGGGALPGDAGLGQGGATLDTCTDGLMNGSESDVDCGGAACPRCHTGHRCVTWSDCASGSCTNGRCE